MLGLSIFGVVEFWSRGVSESLSFGDIEFLGRQFLGLLCLGVVKFWGC